MQKQKVSRKRKVAGVILLGFMFMTTAFPAMLAPAQTPHYYACARVLSNYAGDVKVHIAIPRAVSIMLYWDWETVEGRVNETMQGSRTFRASADVQISFEFCNGSIITREQSLDSYLRLEIPEGYLIEAWMEYSHMGEDVLY